MKGYYINLDSRKDRNQHVKEQLQFLNFDIERFEAIYSSDGRIGCSLSHLAILEMARKKDLPMIFICEDDIVFKDKKVFKKQLNCFLKSVDNWDVLLLAGNVVLPSNFTTPSLLNPYSKRVSHCQTTTGYIVKNHYYSTLIENIREGIKLLLQFPENHFSYAIDKNWLKLQKKHLWFIITPLTVTQKKGYSNIEKKDIDNEELLLTYR
jgi:glycosyl transferase family 25